MACYSFKACPSSSASRADVSSAAEYERQSLVIGERVARRCAFLPAKLACWASNGFHVFHVFATSACVVNHESTASSAAQPLRELTTPRSEKRLLACKPCTLCCFPLPLHQS